MATYEFQADRRGLIGGTLGMLTVAATSAAGAPAAHTQATIRKAHPPRGSNTMGPARAAGPRCGFVAAPSRQCASVTPSGYGTREQLRLCSPSTRVSTTPVTLWFATKEKRPARQAWRTVSPEDPRPMHTGPVIRQ